VWCDSLHAVDTADRHTWAAMRTDAVWSEVLRLSKGNPLTVSLSGGNPAIQDFTQLIALGHAKGYRFACETQGSIAKPWFGDLDTLVLSPKPPSSEQTVDWETFDGCLLAARGAGNIVMKIVIFDHADYDWARAAADKYPNLPLYLQPGNLEVDPDVAVDPQILADKLLWLVDKTISDSWFAPKILPQLHVLLWGNKRGV
jgi:7-carboxy-7-deazaguanine synthase